MQSNSATGRLPSRLGPRLRSILLLTFACLIGLSACGGGGGSSGDPDPQAHSVAATSYTGRGWFVDAASGDDTAAGTSTAPWKTLARASTQRLAPGDAVLLKCGATWRESLAITAANAPAGGAVVGAWGSCTAANQPVVSGADLVAGVPWTVATAFQGKPVFVAAWPHAVGALFWNGRKLTRARYPNDGGIGHQFALVASVRGATTLTAGGADAAAIAGVDLAGAQAFVRTNPWLVESRPVASGGPNGVVTLASATTYALQPGQGFFVEGKLAFLDTPGEWFYDSAADLLYVWTPDASDPTGALMESVERDVGIVVSGSPGNRVDQIALQKQGRHGLQITDAKNTIVSAVNALDAGENGVLIEGDTAEQSAGTSVQGGTIRNAGVNGVSATSPEVQITANDIDGTGLGASDSGVSAGIYLQSAGGTVRGNHVTDSAYAAILLSEATGDVVAGNSIVQACRRFTDCGAIYSGGAPTASRRTAVTSNAISGLVANTEGAVGAAEDLVAGIYLDQDSATHDVTHNMISSVGVGINLHNSANHLIQANDVWLAYEASIRVHSSLADDSVRGNVVEGNSLYASRHLVGSMSASTAPAEHLVYAQEWVHASDARQMFNGANPNIVRGNVVNSLTAPTGTRWQLISGLQPVALDAAQWSAYATGDTAASPLSAMPFRVDAGGANLLHNGAFLQSTASWLLESATAQSGGTLTLGSCGNIGCADFQPAAASDFVVSNAFQMSTASGANLFQLRVVARAVGADSSIAMAVNRDGGNFASSGIVLDSEPISSTQDTTIAALFNASSSDPARLNISAVPGITVRFRSALIARVDSYELLVPEAESTLLGNETDASESIDCPALVMRTCNAKDLSGQAIAWPLTLAPHTAKVVVAADGKWNP